MSQSFSGLQLLRHLAWRWPIFVAAVTAAAILTYLGSQFLPQQYTAEARLLIEPPGGADPRSALVVSPVYLDSLKTFALMASSSELFEQALDELGLQDPQNPQPLSALKASILEVEIPRNTKVLTIRTSLPDPIKAQALAEYLAEAVVQRNQQIQSASDEVRTTIAEQARDVVARQAREIDEKLQEFAAEQPTAGLEVEVDALVAARTSLREELRFLERRRIEGLSAGHNDLAEKGHGSISTPLTARIDDLRSQVERLDDEIRDKEVQIAHSKSRQDALESRRTALHAVLTEAESRLLQEKAMASSRGERLQIIDRGVVPDRPSSPRVALNVIVASSLAMLFVALFVALRFGLSDRPSTDE